MNPYAVIEVPPLVRLERDLQRVGETWDQSALQVGGEGDMMLQRIFIKHSQESSGSVLSTRVNKTQQGNEAHLPGARRTEVIRLGGNHLNVQHLRRAVD